MICECKHDGSTYSSVYCDACGENNCKNCIKSTTPTPQPLPALITEMQERVRETHPVHKEYGYVLLKEEARDTLITNTANATLEYVKGVVDSYLIAISTGEDDYTAEQLGEEIKARLTNNPDALKAIE